MSITIKKIAELANVSRGTVDRVIHGREGVNNETRERVEYILEKYNYKSNRHARALVTTGKKFSVGVIINSIGNEFFDSVLEGLIYENQKYENINLIIKEIKGYEESDQLKAIKELTDEDVHALIITPINTKDIINALNDLRIPVVTLNNDIETKKLGFVGCDYVNNGKISGDIANLILPNGGHVAIIVGSFKLRGHNERVEGFEKVFTNQNKKISYYENQDDDNLSYEITKNIIENNNVDLIYYAAAGISGGLKAIADANVKVPVITVDETRAVKEGLKDGRVYATVTQQPYKQGSRAIQMVYDYLVYNSEPKEKQNLTGNRIQLKHSIFVTEK